MDDNRSSDLEADSRPGSHPLSPREGSQKREESQGQRMKGGSSGSFLSRELARAHARIVKLQRKDSGRKFYIEYLTRHSTNLHCRLQRAERDLWDTRAELAVKTLALRAQKKENKEIKNRLNEVGNLTAFIEKCQDKYRDFEGLYRDSNKAIMLWNDGTCVRTATRVASETISDYNIGEQGSSSRPTFLSVTASFPNRSGDNGYWRKSLPKQRKIMVVASEDEEDGNEDK